MFDAGKMQSEIPRYYEMFRESVVSIVRRSKKSITTSKTKTTRRKPNPKPELHRHLLNYLHLDKKIRLYLIAIQHRTPNGGKLSNSTFRRYLHTNGI